MSQHDLPISCIYKQQTKCKIFLFLHFRMQTYLHHNLSKTINLFIGDECCCMCTTRWITRMAVCNTTPAHRNTQIIQCTIILQQWNHFMTTKKNCKYLSNFMLFQLLHVTSFNLTKICDLKQRLIRHCTITPHAFKF